jgi:hypothetical protein
VAVVAVVALTAQATELLAETVVAVMEQAATVLLQLREQQTQAVGVALEPAQQEALEWQLQMVDQVSLFLGIQ